MSTGARQQSALLKTALVYGGAVAGGAFLLSWLRYQYVVRVFSTEAYIVLIAVLFTSLGIWVGHRLTSRSAPAPFKKNATGIAELGISDREYEVLSLLAEGHTNAEIAKRLFVSRNTVKTHLARIYAKLKVSRRTQAVLEAKRLHLIP